MIQRFLIRWCKRYLEHHMHHVVEPGAPRIILSGYVVAEGNHWDGYWVRPTSPDTVVAVINCSTLLITPRRLDLLLDSFREAASERYFPGADLCDRDHSA